ncbi:hypothetical protein [Microbacterium sp. JZ31]|uniref:hypothetical protein n=1 Tax=Microbacterium sp. JZ31 TaxID=1906274 RepID=UPI0021BC40CC|nr:hypothetical protein [Microbacterium sp. JZ31]
MTDQHPATPPAPEQPAPASGGAGNPAADVATGMPGTRETGAPVHGVGPLTIREAILVALAGLILLVSFFSMYDLRDYASIWGASLDWVLGVALPVAAGVLLVIRRLSPAARVRVGSLSVDQFASVAFSVAAVLWLSRLGYGVQNVIAEFPFSLTAVVWLELLLTVAGVFFTVVAPYVAPFKDDFAGRADTVAHPVARSPRPVAQRPRPERQPAPQAWSHPQGQAPYGQQYPPQAQGYGQAQYGQAQYGQPQYGQPGQASPWGQPGQAPQWGQPAHGQQQWGQPGYAPQWGQPASGQQHGHAPYGQPPQYGQPQFPPPGQAPYGQPAYGQQFPLAPQEPAHAGEPAHDEAVAEPPVAEPPFTTETEAIAEQVVERHAVDDSPAPRHDAAPTAQSAEDDVATSVHPILSDDEPVTRPEPVAQDEPITQPEPVWQDELVTQPDPAAPAPQAFWALVPEERDIVDAYGTPMFRIGPTAWALVIEDRGDSFVVRHDDGRIGFLHDVSGITRG